MRLVVVSAGSQQAHDRSIARHWQGDAHAAVTHPAYSRIGLPNQELPDQRLCLLHLATISPTQAEDWRYFGKHAWPLGLKTWVKMANSSMAQFRANPQEIQMFRIELYIITLCESHCTCRESGLCLHAHHMTCSLLTSSVKSCTTWQISGLLLHSTHVCIGIATKDDGPAVNDDVAPDLAPNGLTPVVCYPHMTPAHVAQIPKCCLTFLAKTEALGVACSLLWAHQS